MSDRFGKPIKIFCAVIVKYGTEVEKGFLTVFTVDTEEDAKDLIILACGTNADGEYVAAELVGRGKQTIDNLNKFGDRLQATWEFIVAKRAGRNVEFPSAPLPYG